MDRVEYHRIASAMHRLGSAPYRGWTITDNGWGFFVARREDREMQGDTIPCMAAMIDAEQASETAHP